MKISQPALLDKNKNAKKKYVACVTGATGIIGNRIVQLLLENEHVVRVATRKRQYMHSNADVYTGDIVDESFLDEFIAGADLVFHCAAELNDELKMWDVNVEGTRKILKTAKNHKIGFFCYMSSAGVVGRTSIKWVDETATCRPQNYYEKSKWEAEKLAAKAIEGCNTVILRPTNVIAEERPGAIGFVKNQSLSNRLKIFIKGGECAHIVHAEDVARAAVFFVKRPITNPQCFFVSYDHEALNTFSEIRSIYRNISKGESMENVKPSAHLPIAFPYIVRRLRGRHSNLGDVRYSSKKLLNTGFKYSFGIVGAVKRIVNYQMS